MQPPSIGKPFILVAPNGVDCCAARVLRREGLVVSLRFLFRRPFRDEEVPLADARKWLCEKDLLTLVACDALAAGGFNIRPELRVHRDSYALLSSSGGIGD
jgi:hypothetical protein